MKDNLEKFIGLYHMDKTLRFELKPIGKTLDNINNNGFIDKDNHRAYSYKKVKKLIDRYHKHFIESVLGDFKLDSALLKAYYSLYIQQVKTEKDIKEFDAIQDKLRKSIAEALKKDERFKRIDKKELINKDLNVVLENDDEKILVSEFQGFTSYFTGFHENRKNMYSDETKSTAIAYRLIHENLPKFIDNIAIFKKIAETSVADKFSKLYKDFEECLNVYNINEMFDLDYYSIVLTQKQIEVYNGIIGGKTLEDGTKVQGLNEYINLDL